MNIWYVRAGLYARFGVWYTLEQTLQLLVETGAITKDKAKKAIFPGYKSFYGPLEDYKEKEDVELPLDTIYQDDGKPV